MLARYRYAGGRTVDQAGDSGLFKPGSHLCLVRLLDAPAFGFVSAVG